MCCRFMCTSFFSLSFFFRGDLAITLLVLYKDDPCKLARIMDKLLDREVHQLIKSPVPSSYYSSNPPVKVQFGNRPLARKDLEPTLLGPVAQSDVLVDPSILSELPETLFSYKLYSIIQINLLSIYDLKLFLINSSKDFHETTFLKVF